MLREVPATQAPREPHRRWFADEYLDLVVWISDPGSVVAFELCYDKPRAERAVTWSPEKGYGSFRVDGGGDTPTRNRTPILISDRSVPKDQVIAQFTERAGALDPAIRDFVLQKLEQL